MLLQYEKKVMSRGCLYVIKLKEKSFQNITGCSKIYLDKNECV